MSNFKESEHPRDNEGKFTEAGTDSGSDTDNQIMVTGRELGEYKDIKELRLKAIDYYKKNLQGKSVINPKLGKIKFTTSGYKKPLSFSADYRKLLLFPFLPDILRYGNLVEEVKDKKGRINIKSVFIIYFRIIIKSKSKIGRIIIRKDNNGNLYYDHNINQNLAPR